LATAKVKAEMKPVAEKIVREHGSEINLVSRESINSIYVRSKRNIPYSPPKRKPFFKIIKNFLTV